MIPARVVGWLERQVAIGWLLAVITVSTALIFLAPSISILIAPAVLAAKPVMYDWRPVSVVKDGDDLIIRGTVRKRWACEFVPPPRAHYGPDEVGARRALDVVSANAANTSNWPGDHVARSFGPWRIIDGALHGQVCFEYEHICLGHVRAFSTLGCVNAP